MNRQGKILWLQETCNLVEIVRFCDEIINEPDVYSSPSFSERVQAGGVNTAEMKISAKLAEVEKAKKERDAAVRQVDRRKDAISRLTDGLERQVLYKRYVKNMTAQAVRDEMYISRATFYRIHDSAVDNLETV